jgi:hypothetical protein
MNKSLYAKTLVIAIAASFLVMAGNGLGIGGQSNETFEAININLTKPTQETSLDTLKIADRLDTLNMAPPVQDPQSIDFQYGFETETAGDVPTNPPWLVTESNSTTYGNWGPEGFEFDTVGQNPNTANWTTVDGGTVPAWWSQNFETRGPAGTAIDSTAFDAEFGSFWTMDPGATLTARTPPAGAPPGRVLPAGYTTGTISCQFADAGGATGGSYFGPYGIGDTTTGYAGGWFYMTVDAQFSVVLYDLGAGVPVAQVSIYPGGSLAHWPGGTGGLITGPTWTVNTWHELFVQYNEGTRTYSVWWDGVQYVAGSAFLNAAAMNCDGIVFFGDGVCNVYLDNLMHMVPASGGTHVVDVSNVWSYSGSGGTKSVYLDQNAYATTPASATAKFPSPYAWSWAGVSWAMRTSATLANSNGATFYVQDFNGRTLMALRCSGGQIQYQNGVTWTNLMAFAASTEYWIDMYMDSTVKTYNVDINYVNRVTGATMVNLGAGIGGFKALGTVSTQSEIYFDEVQRWGDLQPGTVRVSNARAHTGTQSVRMWEGGGDTACDMGAYLGGDNVGYGDFWFWFYGDGTLGGGSVYLMDTTQTFLVTIISLGGDLTANNIPHPGTMTWVNGNGAGGGTVVNGPTITPNTWNNVSIRYNIGAGTVEARLNGVLQGTFGILESGALDAGIAFFFGEGPAAPVDFFFDDIGLWINDLPATPQNLRVYLPGAPLPPTITNYTVNLDSAVEGTVTNTYTNIDEITPLDGLTENIQEVLAGSPPVTQTDIRYFRGTANEVTVNGLTSYSFGTTQDATTVVAASLGAGVTIYVGIRVWKRNAAGTETEITAGTAVGIATRAAGAGNYAVVAGAPWTPTATALLTTDSIVVRMYQATTTPPGGTAVGIFTTAQLGSSQLNAVAWAPYYSIRSRNPQGTNVQFGAATGTRVENFQYLIPGTSAYGLEHRWRTQNVPAGASTMTLYATGYFSAASNDNFQIGYSTVLAGPYTPVITINSATTATYNAALPTSLSGAFYLNVIDSNLVDATGQDTVYIDAIRIYYVFTGGGGSANEIATAGTPVTGTVTGLYTATNSIPADGTAQQIAEVAGAATTFINNEQFTSGVPPTGWTTQYDGIYGSWGSSATANAGGTAPEAMYTYGPNGNGNGRLIAGPFDTTGFTTMTLTFRHYLDSFGAGCTLAVQTSTDMVTWANTGWTLASGTVAVGPALVTEPLIAAENVGSATFYVAFAVTLNSYQINYWYIDAVNLVGTPVGYFATYRYTMQNIPLNTLTNTLTVTGRVSEVAEPFNIGWSRTLAGPYTNVISVAATTFTTYTFALPTNFDGSIFIQAKDSLSGATDTVITSVYIDSLYIASTMSAINTTVNVQWDLSADDGAGQNDVTLYNVYYSDSATAGTSAGPFNYLGSVPAGSNIYRHYGEASDLVNNIWYVVTAHDVYSEGYSTGRATKFNVAPAAQSVLVNGVTNVTVTAGTPVALTANIFDDSSTWEDILKIDEAEWFANTDPGVGLGNAMTNDSAWDSITEPFTATIDTSAMTGNNQIFVRGHEAAPGNTGTGWGAISASVWVNVTGGSPPYTIDLAGHTAGQWVFVSFPVVVSGNIETILNDATLGDGQTTWDVAKWANAQDVTDPWKTYRFGSTTNDLVTINNQMGVWLHLTANAGDAVLTLGQIGTYSVAPIAINLYVGWNLVGYPSATSQLASAIMPINVDYVSVWQAASPYVTDYSNLALVTMSHGNGYWVHVNADCVWTVNP